MATHLVHSNDGAEKTSDWWTQSSWFQQGKQSCRPEQVREPLPTASSSCEVQRVPAVSRHAGGAAAQCRFAGRCAIPIGTTAPVDGSPVPLRKAQPSTPAAAPQSAGSSLHRGENSKFTSRWRFDMDLWKWVPKESSGDVESLPSAKSQLAARRWGNGRDQLPAAAGAAAIASSRKRTAGVPPSTAAETRSNINHKEPTGFDALAGLRQQKAALHSAVVLALRHPQLFSHLGVKPLNVLLHGPPGTGKTAIIPRLAEEARAFLEVVDGAAIFNDAANSLKRAYNRAKANSPSVLFIDAVDALAPARPGASIEELQTTQAFVALLDSAAPEHRVAIVAATNSRSSISSVVLHPHRLGLEVAFGSPTSAERLEIMGSILRNVPLVNVDLEAISHRMQGFVAADCAAVCTRAAMACVSEVVALAETDIAASATSESTDVGEIEETLLEKQLVISGEHFESALRSAAPSSMRHLAPTVEAPLTAWADIGGQHAAKLALQEMMDLPLQRPLLMKQFGAKPSRGALLYGPPGCGKTLLARAAATQCGANFISVSGPQLLDKWFGESERAVRDLFAAARACSPSIIFFDELDSLAPKRQSEGGGGGDAAAARVLTQLLVEMDGFSACSRVFVLGATNRPDALDPALLRPGRLDALLEVNLPDPQSRLAILEVKLRNTPIASNVDLSVLAALCDGMSGADLSELCRRACQLALRSHIEIESQWAGAAPLEAIVEACHFEDALATCRRSVPHNASSDAAVESAAAPADQSPADEKNIDQLHSQWVKQLAASAATNGRGSVDQTAYIVALESALHTAGIDLPKI